MDDEASAIPQSSVGFGPSYSSLTPFEHIQILVGTFALAVDTKSFDLLNPLFAPNATYNDGTGAILGLDAIKASVKSETLGRYTQTVVSNPVVMIDPILGIAGGTIYVSRILQPEGSIGFTPLNGYFRDQYIRLGGEWKFVSRVFTKTFPDPLPQDPDHHDVVQVPHILKNKIK